MYLNEMDALLDVLHRSSDRHPTKLFHLTFFRRWVHDWSWKSQRSRQTCWGRRDAIIIKDRRFNYDRRARSSQNIMDSQLLAGSEMTEIPSQIDCHDVFLLVWQSFVVTKTFRTWTRSYRFFFLNLSISASTWHEDVLPRKEQEFDLKGPKPSEGSMIYVH